MNRLGLITGTGAIDDPLTNIPGLAEAQALNTMKEREMRRSIANEAQPQDAMTLYQNNLTLPEGYVPLDYENRDNWLGRFSDWEFSEGDQMGRKIANNLTGFLQTISRGVYNGVGTGLSAIGRGSEALLGGKSYLKKWGTDLLDFDQNVNNVLNDYLGYVNKGNIDNLAQEYHGAGTSVAFAALSTLIRLLTPYSYLSIPSWLIGQVAENGLEALFEANTTVSDLYAMDKNRLDDALLGGAYSFLGNYPLDLAQNSVEGAIGYAYKNFPLMDWAIPNGTGIRSILTQLAKGYFGELGMQELSELFQEPRQQLTEQAVKNTFQSGDMSLGNFWNNYKKEMGKFGDYFEEVAPVTAKSTFLSHNIMWPLGVAGGAYRTRGYNKQMRAEVPEAIGKLETGYSQSADTQP